jgi:Cu(I)/Ag(I) efflux system membrane fusion protein
MKTFLLILLALAIAIPATWFAAHHDEHPASVSESPERHVKYYQCAMHHQIKSDKPGRCPICGMELTPIYEGVSNTDSDPSIVELSPVSQRVLHVETTTARKVPLVKSLRVAGAIEEDDTRHRLLSAVVDGRIEKLLINTIGTEVQAGQPLAELFSPLLLQAEREYKSLSGDLRQRAALRLRQMGLSAGQIAALDSKPEDILTSTIPAPISGTVIAKKAYEGQYVKEGEILFEIADFSTMWFVFQAYESDLPWLHAGLPVDITTPSLPGRTVTGHISFVDPNFDESTRSTKVRVEIPNPIENGRRLLSHSVFADAVVRADSPETLAVPRAAVLETGRDALVYVDLGDGNYQRREVKTGRRGDTTIEILGGLAAGDKVVTQGNLLIDGQAEINRSSQSSDDTEMPEQPAAATSQALSAEQTAALSAFVNNSDAMAAALGNDKFAGFQQAAAQTPAAAKQLAAAFASRPDIAATLAPLADAPEFQAVPDLKSARAAYHKYITRSVAAITPLQKQQGAPKFDIWECGMADKAIPGVPKKARWIQVPGRPGTNPFYGQDMPDCGELIQP